MTQSVTAYRAPSSIPENGGKIQPGGALGRAAIYVRNDPAWPEGTRVMVSNYLSALSAVVGFETWAA